MTTTPEIPDNPILVDDREGSKDLVPLLKKRRLPVKATRLDFGDVAWEGHGPKGGCKVGIEYKTVRDVLSSMTSGRYAGHQLPGMIRQYDYVYLLVWGMVREDYESGLLQEYGKFDKWWDVTVGQTRFMYQQYAAYLDTMQTKVGVKVIRVNREHEAAAEIHSLYRWWTSKKWEQHGSDKVLYTPPPPSALFMKPTLVRKWATALDGIGWEKSLGVEQKFKTALDLALADPREWMEVPGIGKGLAEKAVRLIRGESEED